MNEQQIQTQRRTDFVEITEQVQAFVAEEEVETGVVTVFIPHTTAGIMINENADPDVMRDMEVVLGRMVPWEGGYRHAEGNTAAHVKAMMAGSSVQVLVERGRLQLGTWQGLYFCEYDGPRTRKIWMSVIA